MINRYPFVAMIAALVIGVVAPAVASAAPGAPRALEYVNLGDSYSAATGVLPLVPGAPAKCLRSQLNFSHRVAAQRNLRLTDVSCGGAETADLYAPQRGVPGTRPQLDALRPTTDLVTVMLGGNDTGTFSNLVSNCVRAALTANGIANPCERRFGRSQIDPIFAETQPRLIAGLRAVHAKSPRARVLVVGYPVVFPRTGDCSAGFLTRPGDTAYIRSIADALNLAVRRAAGATGSTYVDMEPSTENHSACAGPAARYVEPLIGTTQFVPVHPNARGEAAIARQVVAVIGRR